MHVCAGTVLSCRRCGRRLNEGANFPEPTCNHSLRIPYAPRFFGCHMGVYAVCILRCAASWLRLQQQQRTQVLPRPTYSSTAAGGSRTPAVRPPAALRCACMQLLGHSTGLRAPTAAAAAASAATIAGQLSRGGYFRQQRTVPSTAWHRRSFVRKSYRVDVVVFGR